MDKIVSIKQLSCGWEEFDFSSLYRECKLGVQRLPVSVFMIEHRKKGLILLNTGCSMRIRKNPAAYSKYISHHKLSFTEKTRNKAIVKLAKQMVGRDTSFITLIYGEGVTDEEAEETRKFIENKIAKNVEVTLVNGGQPVYYYILSVE